MFTFLVLNICYYNIIIITVWLKMKGYKKPNYNTGKPRAPPEIRTILLFTAVTMNS
jgi:hypothetical protein